MAPAPPESCHGSPPTVRLRDREEATVAGGLAAAVATVVVILAGVPGPMEPVAVGTRIGFLGLAAVLALARQ